jgi:hypothetical protein
VILAIDPAPEQSGWMVWEHAPLSWGIDPNPKLLKRLSTMDLSMRIAIEMIASYGMPVGREVFETCVWIGRFQQASRQADRVLLVPRLTVKMHLCHSAKARDSHVWQALVDRFGPPGPKAKPGLLYGINAHARTALALAVTVEDQLQGAA